MRLSDFDKAPESELTDAPTANESSSGLRADSIAVNEDGAVTTETQAENSESQPGFFAVLKNRNFVTLWSGQIFSQLADKVLLVLKIGRASCRERVLMPV